MARTGRPRKEIDAKQFADLVGLGCTQEEICWYFRDDNGKPIHIDTLTNWCKRTFGMTFSEYAKQNRLAPLKIQLRKNQFKLAEKSAAMAIFLGKNYLGQSDQFVEKDEGNNEKFNALMDAITKATNGD